MVLVLINGREIDIDMTKCSNEDQEEIFEEIKTSFAGQSVWWCGNYGKLVVVYMGTELEEVDFQKVLGVAE